MFLDAIPFFQMSSPPRKVLAGPAGRVRARRNTEEERVRVAEAARVAQLAADLKQAREREVRTRELYDAYVVENQKAEEFRSAARVVSAAAELHFNKKRAKMQKLEEEMAAAMAAREELEQRR